MSIHISIVYTRVYTLIWVSTDNQIGGLRFRPVRIDLLHTGEWATRPTHMSINMSTHMLRQSSTHVYAQVLSNSIPYPTWGPISQAQSAQEIDKITQEITGRNLSRGRDLVAQA